MTTQPASPLDGRARRKLELMRRVQSAALELFEARGFDAVTVEAVAAAAGVGAATVYRHFETKERLALWDEYDPLILEAIGEALRGGLPPLKAIHQGLRTSLASVYRADRARILRRARLASVVPSIAATVTGDLKRLRVALGQTLEPAIADPLSRAVIAAATTGLLEAALERWVSSGGKAPLSTILERAFDALEAAR